MKVSLLVLIVLVAVASSAPTEKEIQQVSEPQYADISHESILKQTERQRREAEEEEEDENKSRRSFSAAKSKTRRFKQPNTKSADVADEDDDPFGTSNMSPKNIEFGKFPDEDAYHGNVKPAKSSPTLGFMIVVKLLTTENIRNLL